MSDVLAPPASSSDHIQVSNRLEHATAAFSYLVIAGGLITIVAAIYLSFAAHLIGPYWDMWGEISFVAHPTGSVLHWLWAQHNEHRILLPKLVMMIDYHLFRGRDIFSLALSFATQFVGIALLLWVFRVWGGMRGPALRTLAGLAALCFFSTSQWENFVSGFQITFTFVGVFFMLAIIALLLSRQQPAQFEGGREWGYVVAAVLAGVASTYSAANGVLVWPVLVTVAIAQHSRKRVITFISSFAVVTLFSYLYHYVSPPQHANPLVSIRHPLLMLLYMSKYVGSPLNWGHPLLATVVGATGLFAAVLAIAVIFFRPAKRSISMLMGSLLLFVLGSAFLTALGRLSFGTDQAFSGRYETFSLLLWLALGALVLKLAAQRSTSATIALQIVILLIMSLASLRLPHPLAEARQRAVNSNAATIALITGVYDKPVLQMVYPVADVPWQGAHDMKQQGTSMFATRLAADLNQPLQSRFSVRSQPCWGGVDQVLRVPTEGRDGLRVSGWAWDSVHRRRVGRIIFVADGKIIGYAERGFIRPFIHMRLASRTANDTGWLGYVEPLVAPPSVEVYATIGWSGREVCRVDKFMRNANGPLQFSDNGVAK